MYALLAHKRPVAEGMSGAFEVVLSVRPMTCFNGFNTQNAFAFQNADRVLHFRTDDQGNVVWNYLLDQPQPLTQGATMDVGSRPWVCLGIGWVSHAAYSGRVSPTENNQWHYRTGTVTSSERCGSYCNAGGNWIPSRRQFTPNEQFIANFLRFFEDRGNEATQGLLYAMKMNRQYYNQLYDFVGSERNSGRAVAYLQVFRNWSDLSYNGFKGKSELFKLLRSIAVYSYPSVIPLLSFLHNNGSDSDILSFAGHKVCSYLTQCGFWDSEPIWFNNRSMLEEGRYNKGSQSAALSEKFSQLTARTQWGQLADKLTPITTAFSAGNYIEQLANLGTVSLYRAHGSNEKNDFKRRLMQYLDDYWAADPAAALASFQASLATLPPITPVAPTSPAMPSDGSAVGYAEWVETTTIH